MTKIKKFNQFNENSNTYKPLQVKCIKNLISIKEGGLNFFERFTYYLEIDEDRYTVAYQDGRFITIGKEFFDEYFEVIAE
jgi:hypothetical protein